MPSRNGIMFSAALFSLALVCHAAIGANSDDDRTATHAIAVDANGDNNASLSDFDGDGTIGFGDFVKFAAKFGLGQRDDGYDARYDLNGDGEIGFSDFVIFAQAFGKEVPSPVVAIPDANLRAAIESALGMDSGEPITQAEMATLVRLKSVNWGRTGIGDLTGLEYANKLSWLSLYGNNITDISPLAGLTHLTTLNLGWNNIVDISGRAGLTHLTTLNLGFNTIVDISGLAGLTHLTTLNLARNDIVDISGRAGLTNLTTLNLARNDIVDISGRAGLTNLTTLDLKNNNISDLTPLAADTGLGSGDIVDVRQNRLDAASIGTLIPALQARGVSISYDVTVVVSNPQIYNDNVFILPVGGNLDVEVVDLPMERFATRFFEYFSDAFDFLIFVPNLIAGSAHDPMVPRSARYWLVKNDVRGIGLHDFFSNRWGSAGQLQGAIGFAWALDDLDSDQSELIWGPILHELMHRWGNNIVPPVPHFGFTSNNGALGGFDIDTLVDHGGGTFSAVWGYDAERIVAYSPLELYLAGFVPPADVPDLVVVEDGHWLGHGRFTASRFTTYTIEDIIAEHGPRVPNHVESQKHFRAAVILLVSEEYPATRKILEVLSNDVTLFSHPGEDQFEWYNFYEATGGRGTITMDGLSQFQRRAEAKIVAPRSFGTPPPPIVDHWEIGNGREDLERTPRHIPAEAEQP